MDVFKRYLIIFVTTSTFLYFFVIWYESQNPGVAVPHNLSETGEESIAINLQPNNAYEKCVQLQARQFLDYTFEASEPLVFNLHYHVGKEDFYLKQQTIATLNSSFEARESRIYCLMWGNSNDQQVRLRYEFRARPLTASN